MILGAWFAKKEVAALYFAFNGSVDPFFMGNLNCNVKPTLKTIKETGG